MSASMEALNKTELVPNTVTVRDRQTLNIPGIQTDRQTGATLIFALGEQSPDSDGGGGGHPLPT